ncbi:uncharacterized protein Tco025E_05990 [Trypanosoma conorhini]|uniref:Uncharacterized protein n=1 Tax=Trypanosoma conorhini TaxID=83891 RepID=A0A3R7LGJ4_9TRYP|nr:uncharacterized protein Tco025E_05990 [Trypanosoma conorhini]RNF13959.1 hypothetical protein Tco025E_05990 [Trypanosoma conorhini]
MWEAEAQSGTHRVDPVAYFQTRQGRRTAGYARRPSQVVMGAAEASGASPRRRGRERGPGKDFARFIEMFGFPERRPQPSSQKRLFSASAQPSSANLFQPPGEPDLRRLLRGGAAETREEAESLVNGTRASLPHRDVESVASQGACSVGAELYDNDEEVVAELEERIQLLEQALEYERWRLQSLRAGRNLQIPEAAPADALTRLHTGAADASAGVPGATPCNAAASAMRSECPVRLCCEPRQLRPGGEGASCLASHPAQAAWSADDNDSVSPRTTVVVRPVPSHDKLAIARPAAQGQPHAGRPESRASTRAATTAVAMRGRSNWTLAAHYAGWT